MPTSITGPPGIASGTSASGTLAPLTLEGSVSVRQLAPPSAVTATPCVPPFPSAAPTACNSPTSLATSASGRSGKQPEAAHDAPPSALAKNAKPVLAATQLPL
jgi:hypothetical protein